MYKVFAPKLRGTAVSDSYSLSKLVNAYTTPPMVAVTVSPVWYLQVGVNLKELVVLGAATVYEVVADAKLGESAKLLLSVRADKVETEDVARVNVIVYVVIAPLAA